ncbi:N-acetylglucosamine-6-phosphate deacetylase [Mucilaginibacter hurinus]|uniref:N-acetylglucosamine-6-phosphate deacetylase n=1 Tax=Mucilaginibacter hurinus TaxID=2201324 RepID=A0A367GND1_9SPHI|nr:N-acetylglucosamine-6-phosphate deacetylase [Mucilaginibacter hurinus]RCH54548.1 N-acetylglucosamine-6-phosphate deacetylase [Mucilaginibacter hurinus]
MKIALTNIKLINNGIITEGEAVLMEGGKITGVVTQTEIPGDFEIKDINGNYLAPGLIDLQVYGSGGKLFSGNPSVGALEQMENDFIDQGTTGFFATTATNHKNVIERAIDAGRDYYKHAIGAFLGLHIEGPFINAKRKGAHPENYIKKAAIGEVKSWVQRGKGVIKMMTIAPELQDMEVIDYLLSQDIILSAGHSDATYQQASLFFDNKINAATHLYNAMQPMLHRGEPGIVPAIFEKKPYTSIVPDGIHVSYPMLALGKQLLRDKLFIITDAVTETTEGEHRHKLNGDHYVMNGTISGSALTMLKGVANCVKHAGIELAEAINMASLYPAKLASLKTKGKIEAGYDADILIFNDKFTPVATILRGEITEQTN